MDSDRYRSFHFFTICSCRSGSGNLAQISWQGLTQRASSVLNALARRTPSIAHRIVNTATSHIHVNEIRVGDRLIVFPHELCPVPEYEEEFRRVFGRAVNGNDLVRAIASYERTQFSFDSPFDRFIAGERDAIGDSAKRGWELLTPRLVVTNAMR
jgi:Di-haem cytochrome c peroxidase